MRFKADAGFLEAMVWSVAVVVRETDWSKNKKRKQVKPTSHS
jgi:hypothetical protein